MIQNYNTYTCDHKIINDTANSIKSGAGRGNWTKPIYSPEIILKECIKEWETNILIK